MAQTVTIGGVVYADVPSIEVPMPGGGTAVFSEGSGGAQMQILVSAPAGSTVMAEKDGVTYPGVEDAENPGRYTITVPEYGAYTVTAMRAENTATGSVTLEAGEIALRYLLPEGYTQLEYIESTGAQYIDTELTSSDGFLLNTTVMQTVSTSNGFIYGVHGVADSGRSYIGIYGNKWELGVGGPAYNGGSTGMDTRYALKASTFSNFFVEVNGSQIALSRVASGSGYALVSYYVFSLHHASNGAIQFFVGRIYDSLSIYGDVQGENLIAQFYPCKRDADDVVGMYDVVREKFYTNAGSGSFVAGPEA